MAHILLKENRDQKGIKLSRDVMAEVTSTQQISVVIPALNEEKTIAQIIEGCRPHAHEIIVVDGHSHDRTREIAENLGAKIIIDHKKARGRPCAIPSSM